MFGLRDQRSARFPRLTSTLRATFRLSLSSLRPLSELNHHQYLTSASVDKLKTLLSFLIDLELSVLN